MHLIKTIGLNLVYFLYRPLVFWKKISFFKRKIHSIACSATHLGLGNAVLLIPLLKSLKLSFPDKKLYVLVSAPVIKTFFDRYQFIDRVFLVPIIPEKELISGIMYNIRHLRPLKVDLYISHFLHKLVDFSLWGFFSRAPFRVTYKTHNHRLNNCLDTFSIPLKKTTHEVERNLQVAYFLKAQKICSEIFIPLFPDERKFARQFLGLNSDSPAIVLGIHPGCHPESPEKRWPVERFIQVAQEIIKKFDVKVVFFIGPAEEELIPLIQPILSDKISLAVGLKLNRILALISQCNVYLGNDSGLMHIAAAFKIPTVALFGRTSALKNKPWKTTHQIIQQVATEQFTEVDFVNDCESIKRISTAEVSKALHDFITPLITSETKRKVGAG